MKHNIQIKPVKLFNRELQEETIIKVYIKTNIGTMIAKESGIGTKYSVNIKLKSYVVFATTNRSRLMK